MFSFVFYVFVIDYARSSSITAISLFQDYWLGNALRKINFTNRHVNESKVVASIQSV